MSQSQSTLRIEPNFFWSISAGLLSLRLFLSLERVFFKSLFLKWDLAAVSSASATGFANKLTASAF